MSGIIGVVGQREGGPEMGHLAQDVIDHINATRADVEAVPMVEPDADADMFLFTRRSDGGFDEMMAISDDDGIPVVFASTHFPPQISPYHGATFIDAPNLSLAALAYMDEVAALGEGREDWGLSIVEHHQEAKGANVSGTAKKIADMLGRSHDAITSVRDFQRSQAEYGIEDQFEGGFAIHNTVLTHPVSGETVTTGADLVIRGRETYAVGTLAIYDALQVPAIAEQYDGQRVHMVDFYRDQLA